MSSVMRSKYFAVSTIDLASELSCKKDQLRVHKQDKKFFKNFGTPSQVNNNARDILECSEVIRVMTIELKSRQMKMF